MCRRYRSIVANHCLPVLVMLFCCAVVAKAGGPWWNTNWRFRVPVDIGAAGYERYDKPADVSINFTQLLSSVGQGGALDLNSLRVLEVDNAGNVIDASVPFQFDQDADFNASSKASGTLVLIMNGTTASGATRHYHVYFEVTGGSFSPPSVTAQVTLTDNVTFEDQSSYQIGTPSATYYYHKQGAAFAGIRDKNNIEWLGYHSTSGSMSGGEYRGIPNMVYDPPNSYFHPGFTNSTSSIVSQGPVKLKIDSKSTDSGNPWECSWEIYPNYARMTVLVKGNSNYWFLVEGIPGGSLEYSTDFVVRSNGQRTPASDSWENDISGPEWVYFGDGGMKRVLYAVHHEEDDLVDSYRPQTDAGGSMVVFGFGRDITVGSYFDTVPMHFTIGFAEDSAYAVSSKVIASSYRDLSITPGAAEKLTLAAPNPLSPANNATGQPTSLILRWSSVASATSYRLQLATDSTFAGGIVVNDSTLTDTTRSVNGLSTGTRYFWRINAKSAGGTGPFSSVFAFNTAALSAPTLVSPSNGVTGQPTSLTLTWNSVAGASSYRVQVGTDSTFAGGVVVNDSNVVGTSKSVTGLGLTTKYYWHVQGRSGGSGGPFSTVWNFTTGSQSPTLLFPPNNSTGQPTAITVMWSSVPAATSYHLQLGTDSTFATGFVKNDSSIVDTAKLVVLSGGTTYYWRVRALTGGGSSAFTPVWKFRSLGQLPGQVQLVSPVDGSTIHADTVKAVWNATQPGVNKYWFQASIDSTFQSFNSIDSTITDTVKVERSLLNNKIYYWKVRATNSEGWGPFSVVRRFAVIVTGVKENRGLPAEYSLGQNYPNPFNPSTQIEFGVPAVSHVRLQVFNMLGEEVATLFDEVTQAGYHIVQFNATSLPSGVYLYRMSTAAGSLTKAMLLLK